MILKSIKRSKVFIPEWMDNKKEKEEDQIKVILSSFPSGGQIGTYTSFRQKQGATEMVYHDITIMVRHIDKIENLTIGDTKINTAVLLCDHEDSRLFELIVEIRNFLLKDAEDLEQGEA